MVKVDIDYIKYLQKVLNDLHIMSNADMPDGTESNDEWNKILREHGFYIRDLIMEDFLVITSLLVYIDDIITLYENR